MSNKYNLKGSFPFNQSYIDSNVTKTSPGNYVLGDSDNRNFYVKYVGRSDSDLAERLKDHIGKYPRFMYSYAASQKEAFTTECLMYHEFGENKELDNDIHPDKPNGSAWKCPIC